MGHIPLGVKLIYEEAEKIGERISKEDLDHIIHIILSHHGEIEYGSLLYQNFRSDDCKF